MYMEGSGVYVSSYNLLVIGSRLGVPMLLIVRPLSKPDGPTKQLSLRVSRHYLPSNLESLRIPYEVLKDGNHLENKIKGAVRMMHAISSPSRFFTGEFTA